MRVAVRCVSDVFASVDRARSLVVCATRDDSVGRVTEHSPRIDAGIDAAEAEGIAQDVIQLGVAAVIRHDIEIAGGIGILRVNRRRHPLPIEGERADRGFDRAGRAERMRVIGFCPADGIRRAARRRLV